MSRLQTMLDGMDIPDMRRDISKKENVRWLIRNLAINNANNPNINDAMRLLNNEEKQNDK